MRRKTMTIEEHIALGKRVVAAYQAIEDVTLYLPKNSRGGGAFVSTR
jgi:hypothetical protein